jgi:tetratricopeptide (TPR) repeat protein
MLSSASVAVCCKRRLFSCTERGTFPHLAPRCGLRADDRGSRRLDKPLHPGCTHGCMRRALFVLLATGLLLPEGCKQNVEVDPAEQQAKLARDLEEAATRLRNNKLGDAERLYTHILEQSGNEPRALAGMGRLRFQQGKSDEAEKLLLQSLEIDGGVAENHALLGELYAHQKRHADSADSYGKAFQLAPEKSEYGLPHGRQLKLAEKYAEAEAVLRRVAELDPMAQFVFTELGDVLRHQDKLDESLRTYMKAQNTYASDKMAHAGAAQVYEAKGDIKHAVDQWSAYIRMDCCSEFSNEVAKKKVMELKVPIDDEDDPEDLAG